MVTVRQRVRPLDDLEITWQRGGSTEVEQADQAPLAQREGVANRIVVKPAGQQHPRLGVGQLGNQAGRQSRRVNYRQRRRKRVFAGLTRVPGGGFRGVGQRGQPPALRRAAIGIDRYRARHHRAPRQRPVESLPGQVVADVQPVQPVGRLIGPGAQYRQQPNEHGDADDQPRHQLAT